MGQRAGLIGGHKEEVGQWVNSVVRIVVCYSQLRYKSCANHLMGRSPPALSLPPLSSLSFFYTSSLSTAISELLSLRNLPSALSLCPHALELE